MMLTIKYSSRVLTTRCCPSLVVVRKCPNPGLSRCWLPPRQLGTVPKNRMGVPMAASTVIHKSKQVTRPKLAPTEFLDLSNAFMDRMEEALEPFSGPSNPDFALHRVLDNERRLVIHATKDQQFLVDVQPKMQRIQLESPISGTHLYTWNARTKRWEDEIDHHDIEGLLTRDLMRLCTGMPLF